MKGKDAWGFDPAAMMDRMKAEKKKDKTFNREMLNDYLNEIDEPILLMDGFDEAFIGISQRINEPILAVYSYDKMVDLLMARDGMDDEEAMEFIDYNCVGAWIGERTPVIVRNILSEY